MELNDTLRIPLAPPVVREAFEDLALLRASFDHCESFVKLADGEFALTITVPLGPLRARYDVRAHAAAEQGDGTLLDTDVHARIAAYFDAECQHAS